MAFCRDPLRIVLVFIFIVLVFIFMFGSVCAAAPCPGIVIGSLLIGRAAEAVRRSFEKLAEYSRRALRRQQSSFDVCGRELDSMAETVTRPKVPKVNYSRCGEAEPGLQCFPEGTRLSQIASVATAGSGAATNVAVARCAVMPVIAWSGEEADEFRHGCVRRRDGTLAWNGYEFDGWGNVLGG